MHNFPPSPEKPFVRLSTSFSRRRARGGFSLIEVALSITIVAFAFVALLGLLPTGMNVFNQTIDSTNEMRISSDITSMLQSTEYSMIDKPEITNNLYYFDADGAALDSELNPIARYLPNRTYLARVVIERQNIPAPGTGVFYDKQLTAMKVMVVMGKDTPRNKQLIQAITAADQVLELPPAQKIRVLPILITKTDGL